MKASNSLVLALSLAGSCFLMPSRQAATPEDSLLVETSAGQRERVANARVEVGRAKDALAASQHHHQQARDAKVDATQRRDAANLQVQQATAAVADRERTGTTPDLEAARERLLSATSKHGIEDARCNLRDRQVARAASHVMVTQAGLDVAVARLDLAKVVAVNSLDRPDVQKPDVAVFEASVRRAEGDEEIARAGLVAAEREVEVSRQLLSSRENGN